MADWQNVQPDEYKYLGTNYASGRPWGIKYVTIHHMAGDLDADACNRVWRTSGASAHYSVDRDGWIVQHVDDTDRAYACGDGVGIGSGGNDCSISIEHANDNTGPWTVHESAIESGAHLVAALCRYYGLGRPEWMVNVFPHSHWSATACPGELAGSQNAQYMARAQQWYDAMCAGVDAGEPVAPSAPAQPEAQPSTGGVPNIMLQARTTDGTVLPATAYPDFAGWSATGPIQFLSAWCDQPGWNLDVQAHTAADGWLPKIANPANINDLVNGAVGNNGPITGIRMYLWSPNGDKAVHYAVNCGGGYYPEQIDTKVAAGFDGYAGDLSNPIYEVKAYVGGL